MSNSSNKHRSQRLLPLLALPLLIGCVDADALISQRRAAAAGMRLEEVDLGKFHISLPPHGPDGQSGVVNFHAFVQVTNRNLKEVQTTVEEHRPRLRHQMLMAVRNFSAEDLTAPELASLRKKLVDAVNEPFDEPLAQTAGFYSVKFFPL
ncbi:flagellar basal body-associated FliL family protein [Adhaeretor mobilis]|uniref:Flagellar protein FliL n=1 Tax=Adhaeretor mobilis TaxID=1930276 RepID=A0A517N2M5_9BACT|nr:flagellar basal body-associated FliL family protein [Adhaeretor mobilis]QDT01381.1 hypothetical protein HG15A2_47230 [Adhaeretor mobilis]